MKEWTIEGFIHEVKEMCRNEVDYDYSRMPKGICNGHTVEPDPECWTSIRIDGVRIHLGPITPEYPDGFGFFVGDGKTMTGAGYVAWLLEQEAEKKPYCKPTVYKATGKGGQKCRR